jgi:hypothetical protein
MALELGELPEFDGVKCIECRRRFRPEKAHLEPHNVDGPASTDNLEWRCHSCHTAKTGRDRKAGKLRPRSPAAKPRARGSKTKIAAQGSRAARGWRRSKAQPRTPSSNVKRGPPVR